MDKIKLELAVSEHFLDAVMEKFRFDREDREDFFAVGRKVEAAVWEEAGFWYREYGEYGLAVITLGAGVDALQEQYANEKLLLECYMAETIAGELLMSAYRDFNSWVEKCTGRHVARYFFFGAQQEKSRQKADKQQEKRGAALAETDGSRALPYPSVLSLEAMPDALKELGITRVQCNRAFVLTPKKSVVFWAELTNDAHVRCEGICMGCGRKDCPNRCGREQEAEKLRWPDLSGRALPYGYARILGKQAFLEAP